MYLKAELEKMLNERRDSAFLLRTDYLDKSGKLLDRKWEVVGYHEVSATVEPAGAFKFTFRNVWPDDALVKEGWAASDGKVKFDPVFYVDWMQVDIDHTDLAKPERQVLLFPIGEPLKWA